MSTTATERVKLAACECCGRKERLAAIEVRDRNTGRPVTIRLCGDCEGGRDRVWRLRYER
ncbi:MAG TPA: hypothetical protein VMI13_01050 [Solirubrobacteraceae bacterium]|nr:hypothetical protein [Solirubrobacteraceae bacterium]